MPSAAQAGKFEWHLSSNVQIDQPVEQQTARSTRRPRAELVAERHVAVGQQPHRLRLGCGRSLAAVRRRQHLARRARDYGVLPRLPSRTRSVTPSTGTTGSWSFPKRTLGVSVRSSSPSLEVRACYEPGGCIKFAAVKEGRSYRYGGCILLRYANGDPALAEVPGANGAVGVMTQGTLTVTAPKRASVTGSAEVAGGFGDFSAYCPANAAVQSAYPLTVYS